MPTSSLGRKKCVILVVEDDGDDVNLLQRALNKASSACDLQVEMLVTRNGMEALSSVASDDLKTSLPNIVVVDLNMPILSGEDFLRLLRTELRLPSLPAVVLTTSREKPVHDAALAAGADQVFVKPETTLELESIAREIVEIGVRRASELSRRPV